MQEIIEKIQKCLQEKKDPVIVSVEGGAGSGKTTLATAISKALGGNLYHMDDFFLPPHLRTEERLAMPGGNIDSDRFYEEVVQGILSGKPFSYGIFDCSVGKVTGLRQMYPAKLHIVEGVYSAHPQYEKIYTLRIFLDVDPETQRQRILQRDREKAPMFFEKWIPMENRYFSAFSVREKSDIILMNCQTKCNIF